MRISLGAGMGNGLKMGTCCGMLLLGLSFGCQSPESGSNPQETGALVPENEKYAPQSTDTLSYFYESFRLETTFTFPEDTSASKDSTVYSANFPHFENKAIQAFVMKSQLGSDSISLQKAAETFIDEYERFQQSFPFPRPWNHETNTKVLQISGSYIGLQTDHYNYTGGAHGNYNTLFTHFWIPDKKELDYPELIDTSRLMELLPIAEHYFWIQEKEKDQGLSLDLYFFDNDQFYLPKNLAFERDSLLFLYNIYEIKPYVYGQTELRLPYSAISPFLTEKARAIIKKIKEK